MTTKKNITAISILLVIILGAIGIGIALGNIGAGNGPNVLRLGQPRTVAVKYLDGRQATLLHALLRRYDAKDKAGLLAASLDTLAPRLDHLNLLEKGVHLNDLSATLESLDLNV